MNNSTAYHVFLYMYVDFTCICFRFHEHLTFAGFKGERDADDVDEDEEKRLMTSVLVANTPLLQETQSLSLYSLDPSDEDVKPEDEVHIGRFGGIVTRFRLG